MNDPILLDDWHPVAAAGNLVAGIPLQAHLLGQELVLWRDASGRAHAWKDRCPHRGTRLSIGHVSNDQLVCNYHGWRFGTDGRCTLIPSQPGHAIPDRACVATYACQEHYGLVWVCLGLSRQPVVPFPEYADPHLRKVLCGPYQVRSSGPRIIENFLDMAHFAFVHGGILGAEPHTEVVDYRVDPIEEGGLLASRCMAWQPQTNSLAHGGSEVEYTYRVVRPLTAILTKLPSAQKDFREAISMHIQPLDEELSQVWIILALTNFEQDDATLRAFQDRIFLQDQPILENQVPLRLPISADAELPVRCDRMSVAYRRYLRDSGLLFGVVRN